MAKKRNRLVLIDCYALIFRAYYAFPPTLKTADGELTNAVYGFSSLLIDVISKFQPEHLVAVFDPGGPTIRQSEYVLYKANRKETPDDFKVQIPRVKEVLNTFEIPVVTVDGFEADDVIGTMVEKYSDKYDEVIVVTGDQDIFQLISDNVFIYLAGRRFSESKIYKADDVLEKLEIRHDQVIDYKGLCGDPSDNIPGVKGVGKKTAVTLLNKYDSLEKIYENIDEIKGAVQTKLMNDHEMALKSQSLATIHRDVPLSFDLSTAKFSSFPLQKVKSLFEYLEFKSVIKKLEKLGDQMGLKEIPTLFDDLEEEVKNVQVEKTLNIAFEKEVYLYLEFENSQDFDNLSISKALGSSDSTDQQFEINQHNVIEVIQGLIKDGAQIYIYGLKELYHYLENKNITLNKDPISISLLSFVYSGGQAKKSIEEIYKYWLKKAPSESQLGLALKEVVLKIEEVKEKSLDDLVQIELDTLKVVVTMEKSGIAVDSKKIEDFDKKLTKLSEDLTQDIYDDVGHEFNINSPKQVGEVLFDERGLQGGKKTKSGQYSTSESTLKELAPADDLISKILKYREVEKLKSTYIKSLPSYVQEDGKIYATFDQAGAVSGRFSSSDPNMQNIPANKDLGVNVRDVFVASDKSSTLVAFDYSQQELRILAALANAEIMIDSFQNDIDIHKLTASEIYGVPIGEVTKKQRGVGKTINFSVVYGISSYGLSQRLDLDRGTASEFIKAYYAKYPAIEKFFEDKKKEASTKGFLTTVLGRKRFADDMNVKNRFRRQAAEREILNFTIQGSAADVMKKAMIEIGEKILPKFNVSLIAQIHDEFLFELKDKKQLEDLIKEVTDLMENIHDIGVPYKVGVKVGDVWGSMEERE